MIKKRVLLMTLARLRADMRECSIDLGHLYPKTDSAAQLNGAADVVGKWIESIERDLV